MKMNANSRPEGSDDQRRYAVLIDADNAQPSVIEPLLAEIAKFGVASVKRIYGDWASTQTSGWKKGLLRYSFQPVQQFAYTKGKNATDISLTIDAMDLLYTRRYDGFCLVSSDSDFTPLAQRLRQEGLVVIGFGEKKTPESFVAACDKFIYVELLREQAAEEGVLPAPPPRQIRAPRAKAEPVAPPPHQTQPLPVDFIVQAIEEASDDAGWAHLGSVGNYLQKVRPDFDPRLYGAKKLSDLLRMHPQQFLVEERKGEGGGKSIFVSAAKR